jgi:hypothetical protein
MRRILVMVTLAVAMLSGCGGDDGDSSGSSGSSGSDHRGASVAGGGEGQGDDGPGDAEDAIVGFLEQQIAGQWGPLYDRLHPEHQALVSREDFVACGQRMQSSNPIVTTTATEIEVVDTYHEEVTLPGTDTRAESLAATIEITDRGTSAQRTFHLMEVDGEWRWMLAEAQLAEC